MRRAAYALPDNNEDARKIAKHDHAEEEPQEKTKVQPAVLVVSSTACFRRTGQTWFEGPHGAYIFWDRRDVPSFATERCDAGEVILDQITDPDFKEKSAILSNLVDSGKACIAETRHLHVMATVAQHLIPSADYSDDEDDEENEEGKQVDTGPASVYRNPNGLVDEDA